MQMFRTLIHRHSLAPAIVVCISLSLFLCVAIRTANQSQLEGKYLVGTDAYQFLRQADMIANEGRLPQRDTMRWQPEGRELSTHLNLFSYVLAYSYQILQLVQPDLTLYHIAVYAPIVCYTLCLLLLYLICQRVFDVSIALWAVNFAAVFPSSNLHRSAAGFANRDAFCLLLWLAMVWFYLMTIDRGQTGHNAFFTSTPTDRQRKLTVNAKFFLTSIVPSIISGVAAGLLGLAWEGVGLATVSISVWTVAQMLRDRFSAKDTLGYIGWYVCYIFIILSQTGAYHDLKLPYVWVATVVPTLVFLCVLVFGGFCLREIRNQSQTQNIVMGSLFSRKKGVASCLLGSIVGVLGLLFLAGVKSVNVVELLGSLFDNFMSPLGRSRLMRTVFELRDLSGIQWLKHYSVTAIMAMAGSALLAYRFFMSERVIFRWAIIGFEVLLCGTLISLFIANTSTSHIIYTGSILIGLATVFFSYLPSRNRSQLHTVSNSNAPLLLVLIWLLTVLFSCYGAERYVFFLDVLLAMLSSLCFVTLLRFVTNSDVKPVIELCGLGLLIVTELYVVFRLSLGIKLTELRLVSLLVCFIILVGAITVYLGREQISKFRKVAYVILLLITFLLVSSDALHHGFIRKNVEVVRETGRPRMPQLIDGFSEIPKYTTPASIIAAWWPHGTKLNWFSKRATVVDYDHFIPYWIFMMARHVFLAASVDEALAFLKAHRATHLLITTEDLVRFSAVSYTGADSHFDRVASVHFMNFVGRERMKDTIERSDFIPHNSSPMDILQWNGKIYQPGHWRIEKISIIYDVAYKTWKAVVDGTAGTQRFSLPAMELRVGGVLVNQVPHGVPGSIVVLSDTNNRKNQVFYITEQAKQTLAVRLYLFLENIPAFSLVYDTNTKARCDRDGFRLWEINYPPSQTVEDRYLAKDFAPTQQELKKSWLRGDFVK